MKSGRAFIDNGFRPVITKEGPKWTQVVVMDGTHVKVRRIRGTVLVDEEAYPNNTTKELARKMMCRTNCLGIKMDISKTARKILQEARS